MYSAAQGDNGLHDLRPGISTTQAHDLLDNVDMLGPHLLDETDQRARGSPGHNPCTTLSEQLETAPTIDWGFAAAAAAAPAGTLKEKHGHTACLEPPAGNTLEQSSERLALECYNLRGQVEAALGRATAAEDRVRRAEELTQLAEERVRVAEELARAAEERARVAEAAVVRLAEEHAAAAAQPILPMIDEVQGGNGVAAGPPPDFLAIYGTSWEPLQCQKQLLAQIHQKFAASYHAAREALVPGNNILQVEGELGRGGFGGVYKAFCTTTRQTWAIKKPVTENDKKTLNYEIIVYSRLPAHAYILGVLAMYDCPLCPALALECGTCDFSRALANRLMSFEDELECMADVAMGTGHCHDNGIVICDIKPSNVILVHNGARYVGKVADFGLASGIGQTRGAGCGTAGFFPPEVARSSTLAEPSTDTFSVGAMLAIVALLGPKREANAFAHKIFRTAEENLQLEHLAQTDHHRCREMVAAIGLRTMQLPEYGFAKKVTRPSLLNKMPGSCTMALRKLIRTMTSANPAERPAIASVAPEIRAVASAVRLMTKRDGTSAPATTPEFNDNRNNSNIDNDIGSRGGSDIDGGGSDGFYTVGSAEGMILPPHLLSFARSSGGSSSSSSSSGSTGSDTVSSLEIDPTDENEPRSLDASTGASTPATSLSGGMEVDGGSGGGSAAPPLFGSVAAGGGRPSIIEVNGSGGDTVSTLGSVEGIVLLPGVPPFADDGRGNRPSTPAGTRAVGATGASVGEVFPAAAVAGAGGVAAVGGGGGGGSTTPTLSEHQPLGLGCDGGGFTAACTFGSDIRSEGCVEVGRGAGREAEGSEVDEEEEGASWDWGWEWEGVRGDSAAVGFGL